MDSKLYAVVLLLLIHVLLNNTYFIEAQTTISVEVNLLEKSQTLCHNRFNTLYKLPHHAAHMASYLAHQAICFHEVWRVCLHQNTILSDKMKRHQTGMYPCFKGHFVNGEDLDGSYNIQTLDTHQVKLTFLYFNLKRSYSGCTHHKVEVNI